MVDMCSVPGPGLPTARFQDSPGMSVAFRCIETGRGSTLIALWKRMSMGLKTKESCS